MIALFLNVLVWKSPLVQFPPPLLKVIGWIEDRNGNLRYRLCNSKVMGYPKPVFSKGVPIVIGGHLIRKILAQANLRKIDCWQQPWRFIYEGYVEGKWCVDNCLRRTNRLRQ